jgi:NADH-quinone oxidoreductase subunit L
VLGVVTSLLTAIYMFRLVFLAFHGERRGEHDAAAGHEPAAAHGHGGHGHGHAGHAHTPHDAPPSMAIPLVILAVGSVLAGYIGVPHALGGSNWIESFLHPSFVAGEAVAGGGAEAHAPAAAEEHGGAATELMLMAISTGVAFAGIGIAMFFWLRRPDAAVAVAERFGPVHRLLYNKYYVDEIYDAIVVQPIKYISTAVLWRGDMGIVDGTVNGIGHAVRGGSMVLRRLQTGSVRAYAASLFFGVVAILGWYFWAQ